ncbi:hypothetical protein KR51_00017760 [Rubidibacter lacunae KORDI 51-2]|uniref:Uncharacterized protein n=1 Tax=Rubidibacter lacunae KORDI 51-2 TaxID=582515 RepID=U5DAG6_9CHRO|nr:hypothetical protein KR51_00017760 [Rubidibacter lacunae KORDI 51-2]
MFAIVLPGIAIPDFVVIITLLTKKPLSWLQKLRSTCYSYEPRLTTLFLRL